MSSVVMEEEEEEEMSVMSVTWNGIDEDENEFRADGQGLSSSFRQRACRQCRTRARCLRRRAYI